MARETVEVVFILTHDIGPWELSRWSDILAERHLWKASAHVALVWWYQLCATGLTASSDDPLTGWLQRGVP